MHRRVGLAAALWLFPVAAQAMTFEPRGWTADGGAFAYAWGDDFGPVQHAVVVDARTGERTSYLLEGDATKQPGERTSAEWSAWQKGHKLVAPKPAEKSADGLAQAAVSLTVSSGAGKWDGPRWSPSAASSVTLAVKRGDATRISYPWAASAEKVEPHWSPDGRRVAWVVAYDCPFVFNSTGGAPDCNYEVGLGPAGTPRVQVLAAPAALAQVKVSVLPVLEKAGFPSTDASAAKKARDKSVVFAAKGFEADAKALAAAVPGGATVEPLSWKSSFDLVVALGGKGGAR